MHSIHILLSSYETVYQVRTQGLSARGIEQATKVGFTGLSLPAEQRAEQLEYLSTAAEAAYAALNELDKAFKYRANVQLLSNTDSPISFEPQSVSAGLGYGLALALEWREQRNKQSTSATTVFATGHIHPSGNVTAIGHIQAKVSAACTMARAESLTDFVVYYPKDNQLDIPDALATEVAQLNGRLVPVERLSEALLDLLGDEYDGLTFGRWAPFKGLERFTYADRFRFFGREEETQNIITAIDDSQGVVVVNGPSGAGKSSLIEAGVRPALESRDSLTYQRATPADLPIDALSTWCTKQLGCDEAAFNTEEGITAPLERPTLWVFDQAEELFVNPDKPSCEKWFSLLCHLANQLDQLTIVFCLRHEYVWRLNELPCFHGQIHQEVKVFSRLTPQQWHNIIEKQAAYSGLTFEPGLVDLIVDEAMRTGDNLPLVEFLLTKLYEQSDKHVLSHASYQSLGGLSGVIQQHAEQTLASLPQETVEKGLSQTFASLISIPTNEQEGLPILQYADITNTTTPAVKAIIEAFYEARLIIKHPDKNHTYRFVHDILVKDWARVNEWLEKYRPFLKWQQAIHPQFTAWSERPKKNKRQWLLPKGPMLRESNKWLRTERDTLAPDLQTFIQNSQELLLRTRFFRGIFYTVTLLFVSGILWEYFSKLEDFQQLDRVTEEAAKKINEAQAEADRQKELMLEEQFEKMKIKRDAMHTKEIAEKEAERQRRKDVRAAIDLNTQERIANQQRQKAEQSAVLIEKMKAEALTLKNIIDDQRANPEQLLKIEHVLYLTDLSERYSKLGHPDLALLFAIESMLLLKSESEDLPPKTKIQFYKAYFEQNKLAIFRQDKKKIAAFVSPDKDNLVTLSETGTLDTWSLDSGRQVDTKKVALQKTLSDYSFEQNTLVLRQASQQPDQRWRWEGVSKTVFFNDNPGYILDINKDSDLVASNMYKKDGLIGSWIGVWQADAGELTQWFRKNKWVKSALLSANGHYMALYGDANIVELYWLVSNKQSPRNTFTHAGTVNDIAFLSNTRVVTASTDGAAYIWRSGSKSPLHKLNHAGSVKSVEVSPNGKEILTASQDANAVIWTESGKKKISFTHNYPLSFAQFFLDEKRIIAGEDNGDITIWAYPKEEIHQKFHSRSFNMGGYDASFNLNGGSVGILMDGELKIWKLDTKNKAMIGKVIEDVDAFLLLGQSDQIFIKRKDSLQLDLVNGLSREVIKSYKYEGEGVRLSASYDGSIVVWSDKKGVMTFADTSTGEIINNFPVGPITQPPIIMHDNTEVFVQKRNEGEIWSITNGQVLRSIRGVVRSVDVTPEKTILMMSEDMGVRVLDAYSGYEFAQFKPDKRVVSVALSNANRGMLALGFSDGTVTINSLEKGRFQKTVDHRNVRETFNSRPFASHIEFSKDGQLLLTKSYHYIAIWHVESGELIYSMGDKGEDSYIKLSPDGNFVLTRSDSTFNIRNILNTQITIKDAQAKLPLNRKCLTPDERVQFNLPELSKQQWAERGCSQFAD